MTIGYIHSVSGYCYYTWILYCVIRGDLVWNDSCNVPLQRLDVWDWAGGNYPGGVYQCLGPIVVLFDVVELGARLESIVVPVQLPHPEINIRIPMADVTQVAFEMADIHGIEADGSDE